MKHQTWKKQAFWFTENQVCAGFAKHVANMYFW